MSRTVVGLPVVVISLWAFTVKAQAQPGCVPTQTPGCGGCACEACVCQMDDYCCTVKWDNLCVDECTKCGGCGGNGNWGPCGNITYQGCCQGETVVFCVEGQLQSLDCTKNPFCGWNPIAGFYDCGTAGGADPSGTYPKACPGGTAPMCGNGVCEAGENQYTCPADCGGAGPVCGNGVCEAGENQYTCPADCGGAGPVCGNGVCEAGENQYTCPADCGGAGPVCGNGVCESGENQNVCPADCARRGCSCEGKECGPDGCGGSCGSCPPGYFCDYTGKCKSANGEGCTPQCGGKQCGPDGCGGECGVCPAPLICSSDGQCISPYVHQGDAVSQADIPCEPSCEGKACGPDGCGGTCGICPEGSGCNADFVCEEGYVPPGSESTEEDPYKCPPGTKLAYGKCLPTADSPSSNGSSCSAGRGGSGVLLPVILLLVLLLRTRNYSGSLRSSVARSLISRRG